MSGMACPKCKALESLVLDTRPSAENDGVRRRRCCEKCGHRFSTYEVYSSVFSDAAERNEEIERARKALMDVYGATLSKAHVTPMPKFRPR